MSVYETAGLGGLLSGNTYPGRGIVVGKSADARCAVFAYFIMGRSENSRNRVFEENGEDVTIYPFDVSKVSDPTLIIYSPVRRLGASIIVTNGDQTDTVFDHLKAGGSFEQALDTRCFEPDNPNYTPRISALLTFGVGDFSYKMNILKSADAAGTACHRFNFAYSALSGVGHFLHTYNGDGSPIPSFTGEPERVSVCSDIDDFTGEIWDNLDAQNKVSLYTRFADLETGKYASRLINKNK